MAKQTVILRNYNDGALRVELPATIIGSYAIHKTKGVEGVAAGWAVTHVTSGQMMRIYKIKDHAVGLANLLVERLGDTSRAIYFEDGELMKEDHMFIDKSYNVVREYDQENSIGIVG